MSAMPLGTAILKPFFSGSFKRKRRRLEARASVNPDPNYCRFTIKLASASFEGRVSDSGSVASGSSTKFS